jgi:hypothetical protein
MAPTLIAHIFPKPPSDRNRNSPIAHWLLWETVSDLVRSDQSDSEDLGSLQARARELEALLEERASEIARLQLDLTAFKIDYRKRVGRLHEELDELELKITEAELGILSEHIQDSGASPSDAAPAPAAEPLPRFTSDAVRKLFRDVAKAIHPDLATDESTRDRHHRLMIEANKAYAVGDEERLRWILESWQQRPEAVAGNDDEATRQRLVRRIAQLEEQLLMVAGEMDALTQSPMWQLKTMIDEAAVNGKDLVREMVVRLRRDIMAARNRLDAIQSTP